MSTSHLYDFDMMSNDLGLTFGHLLKHIFNFSKQCIMNESMFDFLKDHVANIPDVQNEDEPSGSFPVERETIPRKAVRKRLGFYVCSLYLRKFY